MDSLTVDCRSPMKAEFVLARTVLSLIVDDLIFFSSSAQNWARSRAVILFAPMLLGTNYYF